MNIVEMHTASLLVGVLYIVMPTFAWLVLGEARNRAATLWCMGGLLMGVGFICVSAFSSNGSLFWSLSIPTFLSACSYALRIQALRLDLDQPYRMAHIVLVLLVLTALYEYLLRGLGLYVPRALFASLVLGGGSALLMWQALQIARAEHSQMARWIALAYGGVALGFGFRFVHLGQQDWSRVDGSIVTDGSPGVAVAMVLMLASVIGHFGYVGLFLERTQRRALARMEEQTRQKVSQQLGKQMAALERRQSLGEMAASIGHELNQPLTAILSNAQLAKRGLQSGRISNEAALPLLEKIEFNTQRASQILERIRNFMRTSPPQQDVVDLHKTIQDVLALLDDAQRQHGVRIELGPMPGPVRVHGDGLQLSQVVLNLVRNAMDSMADQALPRIRIACHGADGRARLTVRDWGSGVSDAHQAQLGVPFFTTKPQGLGMGLAISRNIARNHGGSLSVTNARDGEGAGALALLELPLAQDAPA